MALAQFDFARKSLVIANVGNIEVRLIGGEGPFKPIIRRGVVGNNAPDASPTEHEWTSECVLVMHSDGLKCHWEREEITKAAWEPPGLTAQRLLRSFGKIEDDATVLVARNARHEH
jgi:hypothetical protein